MQSGKTTAESSCTVSQASFPVTIFSLASEGFLAHKVLSQTTEYL